MPSLNLSPPPTGHRLQLQLLLLMLLLLLQPLLLQLFLLGFVLLLLMLLLLLQLVTSRLLLQLLRLLLPRMPMLPLAVPMAAALALSLKSGRIALQTRLVKLPLRIQAPVQLLLLRQLRLLLAPLVDVS